MTPETNPDNLPPKHAYEVLIKIGGETWEYVTQTLHDLAFHVEEHGPECGLTSGGAGGSHYVHIERRDISPQDYRIELEAWLAQRRK
jgi:hypothetical protein